MEELFGRRLRGQVMREARDSQLVTGFALDAHVHLTGWVLADFYDRKAGGYAVFGEVLHLARDVLFNLVGNGFSVDDCSCHRAVDVTRENLNVNRGLGPSQGALCRSFGCHEITKITQYS